jgi:hypothetical protein
LADWRFDQFKKEKIANSLFPGNEISSSFLANFGFLKNSYDHRKVGRLGHQQLTTKSKGCDYFCD